MSEERRFGTILIVIENKESIARLNTILSGFSDLIIGRQGIVLQNRNISLISLVLEGNSDQTGALSGQLGRLKGIKVKSVLIK